MAEIFPVPTRKPTPIPEWKRKAARMYDVAPEWPDMKVGPTRQLGQSHTHPFAFMALTRIGKTLYRVAGNTYEHARWELEQTMAKEAAA